MSYPKGSARVHGPAWLNAWRDRPHRPALEPWWLVTGALTLVRGGYGVGLVGAPQVLLRVAGDTRPSQRACAVARVLGVRHLAQAALTRPRPGALAFGGAVDFTHAASMVALAVVDRAVRRLALVDAGVESTLGVAGMVAAGGGRGSHESGISEPLGS